MSTSNTSLALVFSILTLAGIGPFADTAEAATSTMTASAEDSLTHLLRAMANGKQCDPLKCVLVTSSSAHWSDAEKFIKGGWLVDTTATDKPGVGKRSYRLTALGVKGLI